MDLLVQEAIVEARPLEGVLWITEGRVGEPEFIEKVPGAQ